MNKYVSALLKGVIRAPLNAIGVDVVRIRGGQSMPHWEPRLMLAKHLGFTPRVIIDGGAFNGSWSKAVAGMFPGAQLVLIEPNPFLREAIAANISEIKPVPKVLNAALGITRGKATFNIWRGETSDASASLLEHVSGKARKTISVDVETLDEIAQRLDINPDLIKLDIQGGELAALKGATQVLKHAEFVIIEFGCLEAYIKRTTPRDIMALMYDNDYCLYDIVDCHYRPYDGALTGGDFFFVKNSSALRHYKGWE